MSVSSTVTFSFLKSMFSCLSFWWAGIFKQQIPCHSNLIYQMKPLSHSKKIPFFSWGNGSSSCQAVTELITGVLPRYSQLSLHGRVGSGGWGLILRNRRQVLPVLSQSKWSYLLDHTNHFWHFFVFTFQLDGNTILNSFVETSEVWSMFQESCSWLHVYL